MARTRKGEETRQRILAAALKLFSARGYAGTSTREIAREAGVAEGTIFHYFPTKKALLQGVLEPIMISSLMRTWAETEQLPLAQALEKILRQRLTIIEKNQELFKLILLEAALQPELREYLLKEIILPLRAAVLEFLEKKLDREKLRPVNRTALVQILLGAMVSSLMYKGLLKPALPEEPEMDKMIAEMIKIIMEGVTNDEGS
ncbi:transcriptional regulator, TetR family [Carboxydocella sporoproducens DSM 16521]|uniref:Transcriptional regulator, TetR family n=2 Tax=Carboxydocella TaxID=178898 RepID=A0A1T4PLL1_9FIRM|nr:MULTISPECIES: TetR/AcrR family transcriptional regulator [Carboxydocella]AVX19487.1 transcriptional regulator, TetR family [Carboxydocella thermautotrophica]AVX29905.1 transcriptional regulator, TetR family [Carboxydocella thermautotrophica]SJZ92359.1 transcriptional regulator, TetR family [Carboxydocella sporoproducens DSM 16521]